MRVSLCLLLGLLALPAYGQPDTEKNIAIPPELISIVVAVTLNESKKGDFFIYATADGDYLIKTTDLQAMGVHDITSKVLTIGDADYFSVKSIADFNVSFDENNLLLKIISAPKLLHKNIINLSARRQKHVLKPENSSAFINYRIGYNRADSNSDSYNLAAETGVRVLDTLFLSNFSHLQNAQGSQSVRLMSSITHDWREDLTRLTAGDFFASSGDLGSTLNLGGLSFSKRYSIDPYFIKRPTAELAGAVATPSEADIYLDDVHLRNVKLSPGEFQLQNLNSFGGSRNIRVIIKDTYGREQEINQDYYFAEAPLSRGLHEYSYNIGSVRLDYGNASSHYGKLATSLYHRYGLNDNLTLGLRAESMGANVNAGPQVLLRTDQVGVISAAMAASHAPELGSGLAGQLGYSYRRGDFNTKLLLRKAQKNYILANSHVTTSQPDINVIAGVSYGSSSVGIWGLNYNTSSQYDGTDYRTTSLSYSKALFNKVSLTGTLTHLSTQSSSVNSSENSFFIGVSYYPQNNLAVRATHHEKGQTQTDTLQISKNPPLGEGWGYRVRDESISSESRHSNMLDSYVQWNAKHGTVSANYRSDGGSDSYQTALTGAVGYIDGKFGFSRPIYDSFGLVRVGDLEGVRISRNNQVVGKTNADGEVFIPNMGSYLENQISIDDKDIPIDYEFKVKEIYVAPGFRSGALINFNIKRIQAISGRLKISTENGLKILENKDIRLVDMVSGSSLADPVVVGKGGEFYIEDIKAGLYQGSVANSGKTCIFNLVIPENREFFTELGDVICE